RPDWRALNASAVRDVVSWQGDVAPMSPKRTALISGRLKCSSQPWITTIGPWARWLSHAYHATITPCMRPSTRVAASGRLAERARAPHPGELGAGPRQHAEYRRRHVDRQRDSKGISLAPGKALREMHHRPIA